ncbi:FUSC family protein [Burkholderia pseudomultivorans]|uniref:FUSC family protein n=1 Tax=Burkholderia pseudomultivorans TaxID=1207504 RepID=UPI00188FF12F|nr:FUSC family protein [Burkholderia pseudomultivorans]MBF5009226.1 FUSC family protein [Burkholderia pseudomultivorans]
MTAPFPARLPPLIRSALRPLLDPYRRYRHAKLIHAARVALAILVSIGLSTGLRVPHGEWSTITVLIVVGGLQHHGNIRKKAAERALGTSIGALAGLLLILLHSAVHAPLAIYGLMAIACGVCAYHAIGKAGYIALLSAITMVIVAGHGDNEIVDGLWRAVNVLTGIAIALAFSFALPLYATYSWRYKLADLLRTCAAVHVRLAGDRQVSDDVHLKEMAALSALLVQLRSLMPSVSKECGISMVQLEAIQRSLRLCISTLEILSSVLPAPDDVAAREYLRVGLKGVNRQIRDTLVGASRALKFGTPSRLAPRRQPAALSGDVPPQLLGYVSVMLKLAGEVDQLREKLLDSARAWNI